MVVVDDADVAVLSLVGTIDVDEIIGPEKKTKLCLFEFLLVWLWWRFWNTNASWFPGRDQVNVLTLPKVVSEFVDIVGVSVEIDGVSVVFNGICVKICVSVELGDVWYEVEVAWVEMYVEDEIRPVVWLLIIVEGIVTEDIGPE